MRFAILAVAFLATACNFNVHDQHLEKAKIGDAPSREAAIALANEALAAEVASWDAEHAVFDELASGYYRTQRRETRFAWMIRASFAPLNEMGQRAAPRMYHAYFLGDKIVAVSVPTYVWNGRQYHELYEATEFNGGGRTISGAGLRPPPGHSQRGWKRGEPDF